ncbi:hypothetical protein ACWATR_38325 [Nostoc sp. UIC 10890]
MTLKTITFKLTEDQQQKLADKHLEYCKELGKAVPLTTYLRKVLGLV